MWTVYLERGCNHLTLTVLAIDGHVLWVCSDIRSPGHCQSIHQSVVGIRGVFETVRRLNQTDYRKSSLVAVFADVTDDCGRSNYIFWVVRLYNRLLNLRRCHACYRNYPDYRKGNGAVLTYAAVVGFVADRLSSRLPRRLLHSCRHRHRSATTCYRGALQSIRGSEAQEQRRQGRSRPRASIGGEGE